MENELAPEIHCDRPQKIHIDWSHIKQSYARSVYYFIWKITQSGLLADFLTTVVFSKAQSSSHIFRTNGEALYWLHREACQQVILFLQHRELREL